MRVARGICPSDEIRVTITGDEVRVTGRTLKAKVESRKSEGVRITSAVREPYPLSLITYHAAKAEGDWGASRITPGSTIPTLIPG